MMMCTTVLHGGVCHRTSTPNKSGNTMKKKKRLKRSEEHTAKTHIHGMLHKESEKIRIKRGVRQGDTISPKLFKATPESTFKRLKWQNKGVKIDGEFLSDLRFADDIFVCPETPQELQHMLQELSDGNRRMGLKMNIAKTKVMVVDNTPINVNNALIEHIEVYVYLGQQ